MKRIKWIIYVLVVLLCCNIACAKVPSPPKEMFLCVNTEDTTTGMVVNECVFFTQINFLPPEEYSYDYNYTRKIENLPSRLGMDMTLYGDSDFIITLIAQKQGYYDSEPLTFNNTFYWENVEKAREEDRNCFLNHTFYLTPMVEINETTTTQTSQPLINETTEGESQSITEPSDLLVPLIAGVLALIIILVLWKRKK